MSKFLRFAGIFLAIFSCTSPESSLRIEGLTDAVEIIRDSSGVNHIYAKNEHDLFFAQGYAAARDRLFQFEIWRRQSTGTVAEILGPGELKRDIGARLFRFRGDMTKELNHYHPHGAEIIQAFTEGINAYIRQTEKDSTLLPLEFSLLGIKPGYWTSDVVVSRHQGLLGNLSEEIATGRAVALGGEKVLRAIGQFQPGNPVLALEPGITAEDLLDSVTTLYDAFRAPLRFKPEHLMAYSQSQQKWQELEAATSAAYDEMMSQQSQNIGSNNWIVDGKHSASGFPLLANDPHRAITVPSLRYLVHLVAPGWNVAGGGEPTLPGVSIGHNENGAWGLTIFSIDGEDLYVYETNPANPLQYRYKGEWQTMKVIRDTIRVKGMSDQIVEHKYTVHGPVTLINEKTHKAFAVRCAWLEPGSAPYLASLRMNQATTWEEFREACTYSYIPGENMIWADRKGNIGWQTVAIAPVRKNWSGLVPVPGDGRFEWDGYLPITELPHVENPSQGFWATANHNLIPDNYAHRDAVGWSFADNFRADRINEVLGSRTTHQLSDMMALQNDYLSLPARALVPLLKEITSTSPESEAARKLLLNWDYKMDPTSVAAGIYMAWEKRISSGINDLSIPSNLRKYIRSVRLSNTVRWLSDASGPFNGKAARNTFLIAALDNAVKDLTAKLGTDPNGWVYGQASYHHTLIRHPLGNVVNDSLKKILEPGPLPRGGNANTPGVTSNNNNQTHGASLRIAVDVSDWENAMFTNTPGQSGNPASPFYRNLFEKWATDRYFPIPYSREKVMSAKYSTETLKP